jgi:DNA invertase Pin-like site-specific DNA recombinase
LWDNGRVSTHEQKPELQLYALTEAGCEKAFTEKASGAKGVQRGRPQPRAALDYMLQATRWWTESWTGPRGR